MKFKLYLYQNAIAFDRSVNAFIGGSADETLSSRAYRGWKDGKAPAKWFKPFIDWIFLTFFKKVDHCHLAWSYEEGRLKANATMDTAGRAFADSLRNVSDVK